MIHRLSSQLRQLRKLDPLGGRRNRHSSSLQSNFNFENCSASDKQVRSHCNNFFSVMYLQVRYNRLPILSYPLLCTSTSPFVPFGILEIVFIYL